MIWNIINKKILKKKERKSLPIVRYFQWLLDVVIKYGSQEEKIFLSDIMIMWYRD